MRSAKPTDARRPPASRQPAKRGHSLAKPQLPASCPQDEFDREEVDQLLLQAARLRANRALSE
jgi:hypothetical protein